MIKYRFKKSPDYSKKDLLEIIEKLDSYFVPSLSDRVDLLEYTDKLDEYSNVIMAYNEESNPIGLIAFYDNDTQTKNGFITLLGILDGYQGQGIASSFIDYCLYESRLNGIERIEVKTELDNTGAISLYKKKDFEEVGLLQEHNVQKIKFKRNI